jgi:hypothetical protein
MDWKARIAAIVLAGGSVAGCASAADPGNDAGTSDASNRPIGTPTEPVVIPATTIRVEKLREAPPPAKPRYRVPVCNANPDPCCRAPQSPECAARSTVIEPPPRYPE